MATAINDAGQIIGYSDKVERTPQPHMVQHAFVFDHGRMKDLGTLGGEMSKAVAINRQGTIVGDSLGIRHGSATRWVRGKIFDLGQQADRSWRIFRLKERRFVPRDHDGRFMISPYSIGQTPQMVVHQPDGMHVHPPAV